MEQYPNEVVIYVTDPRTGVQRGQKFPPTISEIVEACDGRVAELHRNERFRNWGKPDGPTALEAPREDRPSVEELKAKYGENWGMTTLEGKPSKPTFKAPTLDELVQHYRTNPEAVARLKGDQDHPECLSRRQVETGE